MVEFYLELIILGEQLLIHIKILKVFAKQRRLPRWKGFVLTPGRYVGTDVVEEDDEVFEEKMKRLTKELSGQFEDGKKLEERIKNNLKRQV